MKILFASPALENDFLEYFTHVWVQTETTSEHDRKSFVGESSWRKLLQK